MNGLRTVRERPRQEETHQERTDFREGPASGSVVLQPAALRQRVPIFEALSDGELTEIAYCLDIVDYRAGDTVFTETEESEFVGFVLAGRFLITKDCGLKNRQLIIANISEGSVIGEYSMIEGFPRTASAIAIEDGRLLVIRRSAINYYIKSNPVAGVKIMRGILQAVSLRQIKTAERLLSFF